MNKKITLTIFSTLLISSSAFADDQQIARGKEIYNGAGACASCHGPLGAGDGVAAAALTPKPASFSAGAFTIDTDGDGKTGTETDLFNVITNGGAKYGKSPMMAGRPDIAEADRKALVQYIISLKK
jgi:mono/diheme cytochrome c family protein